MFVQNLKSPRTGKPVANQFVVFMQNGTVFQSYGTVCAARVDGKVYLTPDWDYSNTTLKYVKEYLNVACSAAEIRNRIAKGIYTVIEAEEIRALLEA